MASNYKKLGQYLRLVDKRNTDLSITNLQGVSIEKKTAGLDVSFAVFSYL